MKLAYLDIPGDGGAPAVVLHREAAPSPERAIGVARAAGVVGRIVAPFGDYAYYPSGMESGGICWYRLLPGFEGTDPVSLAKAVVQVGDVLSEVGLDRPTLLGFGQGAVVALGTGLASGGEVRSVVCVDPPPGHLSLLPAALFDVPQPPPVLVASTDGAAGETADLLATLGMAATAWRCPPTDDDAAADAELAAAIARWSESDAPRR